MPVFLDLIDALADYEKLPRPTADARKRLSQDALPFTSPEGGRPARFEALLAELNGAVVGYAVFFMTYSTFLARPSLYLEDVFVRPEARGAGAGKALFQACAQEAVRRECGRMEWVVLDWNAPAIAFYERRGARRLREWHTYRLEGEALRCAALGASVQV